VTCELPAGFALPIYLYLPWISFSFTSSIGYLSCPIRCSRKHRNPYNKLFGIVILFIKLYLLMHEYVALRRHPASRGGKTKPKP
jgi:hypothetical protein